MIVPGADRYTVRSPILLVNTCKFYNLKDFQEVLFKAGILKIQEYSGPNLPRG